MASPAPILALIGPTASGKSDLALKLARAHQAHILSCDSLLIYKGMNIGTAKPTPDELASVPHYGIDLVEPDQSFTAGDYVRYARPIIDRLMTQRTPLLIVGGTGFYLKALLLGVWDAPPTQPEIREKLEAEVAGLTPEARAQALHAKLTSRDPEYARKLPINDTYRVIRALEIISVTGKTMGELLQGRQLENPLPYPFTILGIQRSRAELQKRIGVRTDAMFSQGLVAETRNLLERYKPAPRALACVGYKEVVQALSGSYLLTEARERILISTRQLAKKQMTFFRGLPLDIQWFELPAQEPELMSQAERALGASS